MTDGESNVEQSILVQCDTFKSKPVLVKWLITGNPSVPSVIDVTRATLPLESSVVIVFPDVQVALPQCTTFRPLFEESGNVASR